MTEAFDEFPTELVAACLTERTKRGEDVRWDVRAGEDAHHVGGLSWHRQYRAWCMTCQRVDVTPPEPEALPVVDVHRVYIPPELFDTSSSLDVLTSHWTRLVRHADRKALGRRIPDEG